MTLHVFNEQLTEGAGGSSENPISMNIEKSDYYLNLIPNVYLSIKTHSMRLQQCQHMMLD